MKTQKNFLFKRKAIGTDFERKVLKCVLKIPLGQTRSYAWVARKIGHPRAVRAVGQALGKNPYLVLIPCHRVVGSHGSLGGFAGGIEMKKKLLAQEQEILRNFCRK